MVTLLQFEKWPEIVGLVAAIVAAAAQKFWTSYREQRSQTWPTSYGRVLVAEVSQKSGGYRLRLEYSYRVSEEPNKGEFVKIFPEEARAKLWALALDEKTIAVHYDPARHKNSQVWESDLAPLVQSSSLWTTYQLEQKPISRWRRMAMAALMLFAITGLSLSALNFIGRLAGYTWTTPEEARYLYIGGFIGLGLAVLVTGTFFKSAPSPPWMKFTAHVLFYFATFSTLFFPGHRPGDKSLRDARTLSYQMLIYFAVIQVLYVPLMQTPRDSFHVHGIQGEPGTTP